MRLNVLAHACNGSISEVDTEKIGIQEHFGYIVNSSPPWANETLTQTNNKSTILKGWGGDSFEITFGHPLPLF